MALRQLANVCARRALHAVAGTSSPRRLPHDIHRRMPARVGGSSASRVFVARYAAKSGARELLMRDTHSRIAAAESLSSLLPQEIEAERSIFNEKHSADAKAPVRPMDGWKMTHDRAEVSLTRAHGNEK